MTKNYCRHCICLIAGKNNEWICDELQKEIKNITDCPEKDLQKKEK